MPAEVLAAEFTNGSKRRQPTLTLVRIGGGRRTILKTEPVASKRDARAMAAHYGAQPWNF